MNKQSYPLELEDVQEIEISQQVESFSVRNQRGRPVLLVTGNKTRKKEKIKIRVFSQSYALDEDKLIKETLGFNGYTSLGIISFLRPVPFRFFYKKGEKW